MRCAAVRSTRRSAWVSSPTTLIKFTREALRGEQNASFYSQTRKARSEPDAPVEHAMRRSA